MYADDAIELNTKNLVVSAASGTQFNTPLLKSSGEISDKTSTISNIRLIYNGHTHNETNTVTLNPNQKMS